MRVFVTGATGWVGSSIVRDLIEAGDTVLGLVRSAEKAERLAALGAVPIRGSLDDLDILKRAAEAADGVIHTAFGLDFSKIVAMSEQERAILTMFGDLYVGSDRAIVGTAGFGLLPPGERFLEEGPLPSIDLTFPRAPEHAIAALGERGIRASVVRLPRSVHGRGETHGFVPMLARLARDKGVSAYIGDGENLWPSVHRLDAARLYGLALRKGKAGERYHAVADEGVPFRRIAEAIGRQLCVPVHSLTTEEADGHFGPIARWVAGNGPASSAQTRERLGWVPREADLLADIDHPDYYGFFGLDAAARVSGR